MSSGFAGSSTRGLNDLDREIEYRLGATNFRPPPEPGVDNSKSSQPHEAPQDLTPAGQRALHSAGDPKDQDRLDWLDRQVSAREQGIKKPDDQFPGGADDDLADDIGPEQFHRLVEARLRCLSGDNAALDPHATDPSRLTSGTERADNPDLNDQRRA